MNYCAGRDSVTPSQGCRNCCPRVKGTATRVRASEGQRELHPSQVCCATGVYVLFVLCQNCLGSEGLYAEWPEAIVHELLVFQNNRNF